MSRKGNSPDNGMMESFFGILSLRCFMVTRRRFTHLSNWNKLL
ncbi:transposase [Streptococcus thermophilus]|nr:transposase [Streptococcus thermophilus]CAD0133553.1 transposase [Streptococcus thermophilus]CAD0135694.1 transposase [Streptococcus thermophilus]CAD0181160.1 transposase [Streptococcus thermophilus]CAD0191898.1 transposase [Streptococcus thermophilus]